jgi:hypothetical protein
LLLTHKPHIGLQFAALSLWLLSPGIFRCWCAQTAAVFVGTLALDVIKLLCHNEPPSGRQAGSHHHNWCSHGSSRKEAIHIQHNHPICLVSVSPQMHSESAPYETFSFLPLGLLLTLALVSPISGFNAMSTPPNGVHSLLAGVVMGVVLIIGVNK